MAETSGSDNIQLTGKVAFYQKPEPLSLERHGDLGLKRVDKPMLFAGATHVVPVTTTEFAHAALDFPIIFAGEEHIPLAVMGLREGENFFINDEGEFEPHRYVPAFIRRYPFVFAEDKANERFVACIDVEAASIQKEADFPFFENGEPTQYTKDSMEFLKAYEQQRRQTMNLVERLKVLDLFDNMSVTVAQTNPDGTQSEPRKIVDYVGVSGEKLNQLPPETLAEMRSTGELAAIYAHALSLNNWQYLISRAGERMQQAQAAAN